MNSINKITNPFDNSSTCYFELLNVKKEAYYIHNNYKNIELLEKLKKSNILDEDYLKSYFNSDKIVGCCKCVNIILYINIDNNNNKVSPITYITSIFFSAVNMYFLLNEYILRLYIDSSVIEFCEKNEIFKIIYDYIFKLPNVEIYLIDCHIDQAYFKRIYRFLSLIDEKVCINIIREADGYVTFLDCHNIL